MPFLLHDGVRRDFWWIKGKQEQGQRGQVEAPEDRMPRQGKVEGKSKRNSNSRFLRCVLARCADEHSGRNDSGVAR